MEIEVQLTEAIINRSLHLHYQHAPARQKYNILYVPAAMVFIAVYMMVTDMNKKTFGTNAWLGALYIGFAIAYFLYMRHRREHTGKQLLRSLGENSLFTMDVTDDQLVTKLADSTVQHGWNIFIKALITKDLVLLYQQNNSFSMFERTFFANDDMDRFKTMVHRHVADIKEV